MNIRIMIHVYLITSTNSIFKLTNVYFLIKISSLVKFIQPELPNSIIFYSINTGGSFGANSLQSEIGLGQSKQIQTLTITWPNSETQIYKSVGVNKKYKLIEGQNNLIEEQYEKVQLLSKELIHHKKQSNP